MDKHKKNNQKEKRVKRNLKTLLLGSPREITIPGSRFPNGTQNLVPVVDIQTESPSVSFWRKSGRNRFYLR